MKRIPKPVALAGLAVVAALSLWVSTKAGSTARDRVTEEIVLRYRLPRGILAFLVGASLGASGVVFQGLFRNALADPFVVGVSGGAALGAVVSIVSSTGFACAGGIGAAFVGYVLARVRGRVSVAGLLLAGTALSSFCG